MRRNTKRLSQDSRHSQRDWNRSPPECKLEVFPQEPTWRTKFHFVGKPKCSTVTLKISIRSTASSRNPQIPNFIEMWSVLLEMEHSNIFTDLQTDLICSLLILFMNCVQNALKYVSVCRRFRFGYEARTDGSPQLHGYRSQCGPEPKRSRMEVADPHFRLMTSIRKNFLQTSHSLCTFTSIRQHCALTADRVPTAGVTNVCH
jgi:hypothetical protein